MSSGPDYLSDSGGLTVSIVICTDGRPASLAKTLTSLRYLTGPKFEVVVVRGPAEDGVTDVLEPWAGLIKVGRNPARNLSASRNLGISLSAGDIVAFLDDDAIPEPHWLKDLAYPFQDKTVGVAGGFVFSSDGISYQCRYATVDRLGRADASWQHPTPEFVFPLTANFPHPLGANCAFQRLALEAVCGFDEEFDYYLDETDVTVRLVDAGWRVAQVAGAHVHHRFAASDRRSEDKIITSWYSLVKNHIYFGLVNGRSHFSLNEIIKVALEFIERKRRELEHMIVHGQYPSVLRHQFEDEVERAWSDSLGRGLTGMRRLPTQDFWSEPPSFLVFSPILAAGQQRCFCLISQDFPPRPIGGIGRYVYQLARSLAEAGNRIHVVTRADEVETVEFEDGIWVHRILPSNGEEREAAALGLPQAAGRHAVRLRREIDLIAERTSIDSVYGPIWDCEGIALLGDPRYALVTGLQTTLHFWLQNNPAHQADADFMRNFVGPMLAAERRLLLHSDAVHSISNAIMTEVEAAYGVHLPPEQSFMVPLGLADWRDQSYEELPEASGSLRLLFVGRLEARKGIDVLLSAIVPLLRAHPELRLELVGNDTIPNADGLTYRESFTSEPANASVKDRVVFHGVVSEERLRGFYRACDILVTPSRFESFGLMLLEGMMFGKAVIGCRAGGMVEVIEDGVTGLLAEPADEVSLSQCIETLVGDETLRKRLGNAARASFLERFTEARMTRDILKEMIEVSVRKRRVAHAGG